MTNPTETPVRLMPPDDVLIEMLKKSYMVASPYRVGVLKRQIECEAFQAWLERLRLLAMQEMNERPLECIEELAGKDLP
jgi:hypothetical protein